MTTIVKIIPVILLLTLNVNAIAQTDHGAPEEQLQEDWNIMSEEDFEIAYPADWDLDQSGFGGSTFLLYSPISSDNDSFRENVNLLIQDLSGYDIDMDEYVELTKDQLEVMVADLTIKENARLTADGLEYHKFIFSGKQGQFDLVFEQYYQLVDNRAYVLTLTCEQDQFEQYQETGERILNSFFQK